MEHPSLFPDGIGPGGYSWSTHYYRLWYEYLAMSPSYQLARYFREGATVSNKPKDFKRVLSVYDDFGDVWNIPFNIWFPVHAFKHCRYGQQPRVEEIACLGGTSDPNPNFAK